MRPPPWSAKSSRRAETTCLSTPPQMKWACTCAGKRDVVDLLKQTRASVCVWVWVCGCAWVCVCVSVWLGVRAWGCSNCQDANTVPDQPLFGLGKSQCKEFQFF